MVLSSAGSRQPQASTQAAPSSQAETNPTGGTRRLRKAFLQAAATGMASYHAVVSLPESIQLGLDTYAGASQDVKKIHTTKLSILSNTMAGGALGCALGGPVGLVCGSVVGFLSGTIANHLASKSGLADRQIDSVSARVSQSVGDQKNPYRKLKAIATGAFYGTQEAFKNRKTTAKIQLAGTLDGLAHVRQASGSGELSKPLAITATSQTSGPLSRLLQRATGLICGVSGVMINAPGGMIIGTLESLKETQKGQPSQLSKTTMLLATNVGKFLPAAAVGAILGGPVGIAASTAVGVVTASLDSMIDGRFGVNRRISKPVEKAVNEAHGEENYQENLGAYYRAGKGAVVGFSVGMEQGWKTGYQGGVDIACDLLATPHTVASGEAKSQEVRG